MTQAWRRQWGFWMAAGLSVVAYAGLVRVQWRFGTLRGAQVPETIAWYLLAFAAYLGALLWVEQRPLAKRWLWGTAVVFRLLLLLTSPSLSDDVYRYRWDGHVARNGVSPYAFPIEDPALDDLDHPVRALANNTWMASPYLPVAQWLFWLLPNSSLALQMAMIAFDLLAAWLLARLLALVSLPPERLLLYLWNPLVIVEVAHGAHLDAFMIWLMLLAVWWTLAPHTKDGLTTDSRQALAISQSLLSRLRWLLAPLALALATLTKVLPVLLLPVLFWRWSWRQRIAYGAITAALLIPSGLRAGWGLTGELDGRGLFGALRIYNAFWNFNSGLFHWLEVALGAPGFGTPDPTAKGIILILFGLVALAVWWRARHPDTPRRALRLLSVPLLAYVLLSPTVHPWYVLLLLTFLPFLPPASGERGRRWLLALPPLYLSGALIFSYLTYLDLLQFAELAWVRQLEWIPTWLLVLLAAVFMSTTWPKERQGG